MAGRCVDADVGARVLRYDVDQTTSGVAAIQRALRAFENLNSLDIVEREGGGGGLRKIKAVQIGRDGQFGRIASAVLPNAAQIGVDADYRSILPEARRELGPDVVCLNAHDRKSFVLGESGSESVNL